MAQHNYAGEQQQGQRRGSAATPTAASPRQTKTTKQLGQQRSGQATTQSGGGRGDKKKQNGAGSAAGLERRRDDVGFAPGSDDNSVVDTMRDRAREDAARGPYFGGAGRGSGPLRRLCVRLARHRLWPLGAEDEPCLLCT